VRRRSRTRTANDANVGDGHNKSARHAPHTQPKPIDEHEIFAALTVKGRDAK